MPSGVYSGVNMNATQAHKAARAMSSGRYGSFAAHIGDAYMVADSSNRGILLQSFRSLFDSIVADLAVEA
jgi:hypothetical protein